MTCRPEKHAVRLTLVQPSHVRTRLFGKIAAFNPLARFLLPLLEPHEVAQAIVNQLERGESATICLPALVSLTWLYRGMTSWLQDFTKWVSLRNMRNFRLSCQTKAERSLCCADFCRGYCNGCISRPSSCYLMYSTIVLVHPNTPTKWQCPRTGSVPAHHNELRVRMVPAEPMAEIRASHAAGLLKLGTRHFTPQQTSLNRRKFLHLIRA